MFPAKPSNPNIGKQSVTRLRVRAAIRWRSVWLLNYSMTASPAMACRAAKIGEPTLYYHKKNDPDFAQLMESAKAHAIDLLHTRCFQRALEGDIEPIHWQGVVVDYVRKFPERLQIEMLRAHMPATFKTPGQGNINIDTGDKILVMTEELRAKLIALHREEIMDMPTNQEGEDEGGRKIAEGES
jgi:predicted RNA-binding protein with PUA-like domain